MEIPVGASQPHLLIDEPAQRRRYHGRRRIPHAGVADQREVKLELGGIVLDEAEQVVRAAFLLALDHHGDGERQFARDGRECATRLDEGHHLAFVVAGPARHDDLAAVGQRRDARGKWRRLPKVERIDGLHVVMAIKEDARGFAVGPLTPLAHHDRMTVGRTDAGFKADAGQVLGHVFGGGLTLLLVGRIGRDRLDAQELEQPLEALIEIGVDFLQDGGKGMRGGHGIDALFVCCPGCHHPRNETLRKAASEPGDRQGCVPRWSDCRMPPLAAGTAGGTRHRRKMPPMVPRTMARPTELPILPPIDLPMSAATWPATRLLTERVTSRAITWPVESRVPRGRVLPKMSPSTTPIPLSTAPRPEGCGTCSAPPCPCGATIGPPAAPDFRRFCKSS